jgi:hypothetical protein
MTKLVVIIQILVAERNAEYALPDERADGVLDEPRVSRVAETSRNPANQVQTSVGGAPTAGRPRWTSARRRRTQPLWTGLRPVQTRSVLRYTPSASGRLSKSAQVVLKKQLLPDSATRCATQFEKSRLTKEFTGLLKPIVDTVDQRG